MNDIYTFVSKLSSINDSEDILAAKGVTPHPPYSFSYNPFLHKHLPSSKVRNSG